MTTKKNGNRITKNRVENRLCEWSSYIFGKSAKIIGKSTHRLDTNWYQGQTILLVSQLDNDTMGIRWPKP